MSLRINSNIDALNAYRNLSTTQNSLSGSLEKLSSGFRINKAADDAAGLAISQGLQQQIGGLQVGVRNAQDGISVAQTADGALTEVQSMLQRMSDLSVQYNNGTQDATSKAALSAEFGKLQTEIGTTTTAANFNGVSLFTGTALSFQVGSKSTDTLSISTSALATIDVSALDITSATASTDVKTALDGISAQRAEIGATQNLFQHRINSTNVAITNLTASKSQLTDTDMASEMVNFTRSNILSQAGTSMLAQANQVSQGVLKLLG